MESHVNKICQTAYIHMRNISKVTPYITKDARGESLVHAFISSRLDSVNAVLYGLPKFLIEKLQRVQKFSARLITGSYKYDHITSVLSLYWLPVEQRIRFKIAVLSFKFIYSPWLSAKPCWIVHSQTNSKHFQWQTNFVYTESENTLWWEVLWWESFIACVSWLISLMFDCFFLSMYIVLAMILWFRDVFMYVLERYINTDYYHYCEFSLKGNLMCISEKISLKSPTALFEFWPVIV